MNERYQFINWFPDWQGVWFQRFDPECSISVCYEWSLCIGFFEVRKWVRPQDAECRLTAHNKQSVAQG